MQVFSSQKKKRELFALLLLVIAGSVASYGYAEPLISGMSNTSEIRDLATQLGPLGPLTIIGLQFAQVLIAPLPPLTPVISGMLYGFVDGIVYSMIGAALGSILAIVLSRRYGRGFVEGFLTDEAMEKFDKFTSGHGFLPFIVLFTFPGFPDDALCFIAGLTVLDWKKLAFIASLGRLPGIALLVLTGSSMAEANFTIMLAASSAIAFISAASIKYEEDLEALASDIEHAGLQTFSRIKHKPFL